MTHKLFIPISRIDKETRMVYGVATRDMFEGQPAIDTYGTVFDYDASRAAFTAWSESQQKNSNGKSKGNVRVMHTTERGGKVTEMNFNDTERSVELGIKVTNDKAFSDVEDGVLTGLSIGAKILKVKPEVSNGRSFDRVTSYRMSETSLVDRASCPGTSGLAILMETLEDDDEPGVTPAEVREAPAERAAGPAVDPFAGNGPAPDLTNSVTAQPVITRADPSGAPRPTRPSKNQTADRAGSGTPPEPPKHGAPSTNQRGKDCQGMTEVGSATRRVVRVLHLRGDRFPTVDAARAWAKDRGFRAAKISEADKMFHVEQWPADRFSEGTDQKVDLGDGVTATTGVLKDDQTARFLTVLGKSRALRRDAQRQDGPRNETQGIFGGVQALAAIAAVLDSELWEESVYGGDESESCATLVAALEAIIEFLAGEVQEQAQALTSTLSPAAKAEQAAAAVSMFEALPARQRYLMSAKPEVRKTAEGVLEFGERLVRLAVGFGATRKDPIPLAVPAAAPAAPAKDAVRADGPGPDAAHESPAKAAPAAADAQRLEGLEGEVRALRAQLTSLGARPTEVGVVLEKTLPGQPAPPGATPPASRVEGYRRLAELEEDPAAKHVLAIRAATLAVQEVHQKAATGR